MLKKTTPVILVRSLNVKRGGITKATIKKANFLSEQYKEVIIVTFLYQQNHKRIIQELYKRKILSEKVKVLNFFEDLKPNRKKVIRFRNKQHLLIQEKGYEVFTPRNKKSGQSYRYYKDGLYIKYKRFSKEGSLNFIDYMNTSKHRYKREEFDERKNIVRIRHMDQVKNKPRLDRYIDDRGFCYLSIHINPVTGKEGITARFNEKSTEYVSLYKCQEDWLNETLDSIKYPVVFSELRGLDSMLRNVEHKNIQKIVVVHGSHLASPYNDTKIMKKGCISLFKHIDKFDKIVFLTYEQKKDVESIYGKQEKFIVIPHAVLGENVSKNKETSNSENKVAVTLARYDEDKRLEEAIEAFKYVVEQIPEAQYHIYGHGKLRNDLEVLIKKLDLKNNVFLKGYSLNPYQVYRSSACSILTSRQEGFGMVLTESMASGTPVICYDIKYGPKDIVIDSKDGFIVPNGDREFLADRIIKIMENDEMRARMSKSALDVHETFSEERYQKNWLNLIKGLK